MLELPRPDGAITVYFTPDAEQHYGKCVTYQFMHINNWTWDHIAGFLVINQKDRRMTMHNKAVIAGIEVERNSDEYKTRLKEAQSICTHDFDPMNVCKICTKRRMH